MNVTMTSIKDIIIDTIESITLNDFDDIEEAIDDMDYNDSDRDYELNKYGARRFRKIRHDAHYHDRLFRKFSDDQDDVNDLRIVLGHHTKLIDDLRAHADSLRKLANHIYDVCDANEHKYDDLKDQYGTLTKQLWFDIEDELKSKLLYLTKRIEWLDEYEYKGTSWRTEYDETKRQLKDVRIKLANINYSDVQWSEIPPKSNKV